MSEGWVYVLTNRAMPGLIKIGFTTGTPEERARQLDGTALPESFAVAYALFVKHPQKVEAAAHERLSEHRVSTSREFFRCTLDTAKVLLEDLCDGHIEKEMQRDGTVLSHVFVLEIGDSINCPACRGSVAPFNSVFTDREAGTTKCASCGKAIRFRVKRPKAVIAPVTRQEQAIEQRFPKAKIFRGNYMRELVAFQCPHCRAVATLHLSHPMRCPQCGLFSEPDG